MRRYRAVFFDMGDTLVRGRPPGPSFCMVAAQHGVEVDEAEMTRLVREVGRAFFAPPDEQYRVLQEQGWRVAAAEAEARRLRHFAAVFERAGLGERAEAAARALRRAYQGASRWELFPDVPATLARLRREGYRLGVISNWAPKLEEVCAALGICEHFDFILASEAEGYCKPHRHMFDRALALAGVPAEAAVHVGDSYRYDVEGAREAGITGVLLDRKGAQTEPPHSPTIASLDELFEVLHAGPTEATTCHD